MLARLNPGDGQGFDGVRHLFRGRGRNVEFDGAREVDDFRRGAGGKKAVAVEPRLHEERVKAREYRTEEGAQPAIAGCRVVGDAPVGQEQRDAFRTDHPDQVGPKFRFRENHRGNPGRAKHPAHAPREVDRQIDEDVVRTDDFFADGVPGRGGGGENAGEGRVAAAQLFDDLPGQIGFADRDGVNPDARLFGKAARGLRIIPPEALLKMSTVAAAFFHAQIKLRQEGDVRNRKEEIIENPAHGRIAARGGSGRREETPGTVTLNRRTGVNQEGTAPGMQSGRARTG